MPTLDIIIASYQKRVNNSIKANDIGMHLHYANLLELAIACKSEIETVKKQLKENQEFIKDLT